MGRGTSGGYLCKRLGGKAETRDLAAETADPSDRSALHVMPIWPLYPPDGDEPLQSGSTFTTVLGMSGKTTDLGRQTRRNRSKREWAIRGSLVLVLVVIYVVLFVAEHKHLISSQTFDHWFYGTLVGNLILVVGINWYFHNKKKQQQPTTAPH